MENTNAERVVLYLEHGTSTQAEIKEKIKASHGYVRVQSFLELLVVVSQVVRAHVSDDGTCASIAMVLLRLLEGAQPANGSLPDWAPLHENLGTVSTEIAEIIRKSRRKAVSYLLQQTGFYLLFVLLLTAVSYLIICNCKGDLKELSTAFLPQAVGVVFLLVKMAFQTPSQRLLQTLETARLLQKCQGLVSSILEDLIR